MWLWMWMWTSSTMFTQHLLLLLQVFLSLVLQTAGLMSDYKTCGDDACARLMCRVQALRDYSAQDCRFLSFKKGDMIDVYHKLSGRKSGLLAGSRDKDFGYFPRDAVRIDEVFVDEKKEIEMHTQETDFLCIDAFGTIIPNAEKFEDYEFEDLTAESNDLGNSDFDDQVSKSSETNENVKARLIDNDNKDRGRKAEQSSTSWITSAFYRWFANNAGNVETKEEIFKSRKLALDLQQLDKKQRETKPRDWTSALGLKDETKNDEDLLGNVIESVSEFGAGEDTPPSEPKKQIQDENMQSLREEQEGASLKTETSTVPITKDEKTADENDTGWYNSVFNTITNFYGDPVDKSEGSKNEGKARSSDQSTAVETVTISKDEKNPEAQDPEHDTKTTSHEEKQELSSQDDSSENGQLGKGWYGSVYNRITAFYGDTHDQTAAPDKSDVVENGRKVQGKSESKDIDSSPGEKLETNDESSVRMYEDPSDKRDVQNVKKESQSQTQSGSTKDALPTSMVLMNGLSTMIDGLTGAGCYDKTQPSESVSSELSDLTNQSDDDDGEASDLSNKDTTENLTDSDQTENTSQFMISIKQFSIMINGLKSPFKNNNKEVLKEMTPGTIKEEHSNKDDHSDNDDELSVRFTKMKVEEEALQEVMIAEAQKHTIESSLDCNKQDMDGNGENNVERDDFSGQSGSTSQSTNMTDESEAITEEPVKHSGKKEPQSECDTRAKSRLQTGTDVTENESETVDASDEAQDEGEEADVLRETEETAMRVRRNKAKQINHTDSNAEEQGVDVTHMKSVGGKESDDDDDTEIECSKENPSVNITLMEDDEGGDVVNITEMELHVNEECVDVMPVESAGETKDIDGKQMEIDGGKEHLNIPLIESGGENTSGEVTRVKNAGDQDEENGPQNKTNRQKESVNIIQIEYAGEVGGDITQVKSEKEDINFTQQESGGEKEGNNIIQNEQLCLNKAHALDHSDSISETKSNEKIDPDESSMSEKPKSEELESSPSTDDFGVDDFIAIKSDGAQTLHDSKKHGDKTMDVQHQKAQTSYPMQKPRYPNFQAHLSGNDMQVLLKSFSGERLSRLDSLIGYSEYINRQELAELHDFEQTLEHLLKSRNQDINRPLQTIHTVLAMLRKKFRSMITDGSVDKSPDPSQTECVTETCVNTIENTPVPEQETGKENSMNNDIESSSSIDDSDSFTSKSLFEDQEVVIEKGKTLDPLKSDQTTANQLDNKMITEEFLKMEEHKYGALQRYTALVAEFVRGVFMYTVKKSSRMTHAIHQIMMSLPDDIQPGPDLYGVPWEAVIFIVTLCLFTFLLFTCRFFQAIKSRLYYSKERRMGQKVAELLEEKCKVLETLSECEHKFKKLEGVLQSGGLSAQASEREDLEAMSKQLEEANVQMQNDMEKMQEELETQDKLRKRQEEQLTKLEEMLKKLGQEAMERKSQLEQDKTTLKIYEMITERLQKKLQQAIEEKSMLLESKAQLEQEAEGWNERLSELKEQKRMCETSHKGMMENCVNKDTRIKSLTECLLKMRDWDCEEESTVNETSSSESKNSPDLRQKQKVQILISAAKMSADLKAVQEDKDRIFGKLADELKAKEDLQEGLDQLQREKVSLHSESSVYSSEIEKLQHKLQIMSEMYQENELKLHRMLTVEEKERSQKEEQLNKAGKKINLATDELNSYRHRAKELEEELEKTNQAYRNQIAAHEKKAHDNWLAARGADRDLADVKRENSLLRQRLTDWQFKLELIEKNPQARVPLFRGERSSFGPSPLGRPSSETRPFLSPPTLMDGPSRISPQFPMMPGGRAPPGGVEDDRSISYSEGGSPTWERDRERDRRSLGPPGPDPGLVYRRPLSAPFLRAPLPPEAYFNDKSESLNGGERVGISENAIRDNGRAMPSTDIRAGPLPPPPPPFPPVDPQDPHFPHRAYRPGFFPPPLTMRRPPSLPPGIFPRIPLPPHMAFPPMRPPSDHVSPEPLSRPSPPGSEQPPEQSPPAHDLI